MKYNEIIDKIKEFELDVRFEKIEEFKHSEWFDISKKEIPIMEKFLSQLMNADDLDINHNEYLEIDESKIEDIDESELEELLLKKQHYLDDLNHSSNGSYCLPYMPISDNKISELQYKVSKIIHLMKKKLIEKEQKRKPEKGLTLTKKIALLKSIGFYDIIKELEGSNAFKAKITQLLVGGSLDTITKNIKNLYLENEETDPKYTSYYYVEDMKKLVSRIKSETRGK